MATEYENVVLTQSSLTPEGADQADQAHTAPMLTVLSSAQSLSSDEALCKLAQFHGLQTDLVPLTGDSALPAPGITKSGVKRTVLALGFETLQQLARHDWFVHLLENARFVLVYGFAPTKGESRELTWLTQGALSSVVPLAAGLRRFTVQAGPALKSFPVSGKSFTVDSVPATAFAGNSAASDIECDITVDGQPYFVRATRKHSSLFLLADEKLIDIDTALDPETSLRRWYAQLIAVTIFFRIAFGEFCWTAPVRGATIIVDDPGLGERYGFIRYADLVKVLHEAQCALSIAFIPHNYRRSNPRTTELLQGHSDRLSIAVHGCDHTGGEFASLDGAWLSGTAADALQRMETHTARTGMSFDPVMVFPQGRFSTKAIGALQTCGFAAAVNTTPFPVDFQANRLTIRDLLDVAVTRYESFPIFLRRYPRDVFDYAFDALFQKPILVVEHHTFFRHGYEQMRALVQDLANLNLDLRWMPLGQTVNSTCVVKRIAEDQYAVRHFTSRLRVKNPLHKDVVLLFEKPEGSDRVEGVWMGGKRVPFDVESGVLRYQCTARPEEDLTISISYRHPHRPHRKVTWKYRCAASTRRLLSDLRDNWLAKNEGILRLAEKIKSVMIKAPAER